MIDLSDVWSNNSFDQRFSVFFFFFIIYLAYLRSVKIVQKSEKKSGKSRGNFELLMSGNPDRKNVDLKSRLKYFC